MDGRLTMAGRSGVGDWPTTDGAVGTLRLFRPRNAVVALGLTVNYLMTRPPFAGLPFGEWSRILAGQIDRGHYSFVIGTDSRIQGFAGWGLATKENAEAWLAGRRDLSYEDCKDGDCVVFNVWAANSPNVHRYMVDNARRLVKDKDTMYFKRYYRDGRVRPGRLKVNDFVVGHITRNTLAQNDR
jgi:hemolysin-activating ACP:hemolysin acyltransferase